MRHRGSSIHININYIEIYGQTSQAYCVYKYKYKYDNKYLSERYTCYTPRQISFQVLLRACSQNQVRMVYYSLLLHQYFLQEYSLLKSFRYNQYKKSKFLGFNQLCITVTFRVTVAFSGEKYTTYSDITTGENPKRNKISAGQKQEK